MIPDASNEAEEMDRRSFLSWLTRVGFAAPGAILGYGLFEASWFQVARRTIAVPHLPAAFEGLTIAFLTDLHHGRYTSLHYIRTVVDVTNAQRPDIIALGGDYAHAHRRYLAPCFEVLAELKARLGVFGVLGNHDHWYDSRLTHECMRRAHIADLTNTGYWLVQSSSRLRLGGVDDFWEGAQDLAAALGDAKPDDACILLSHNPDYVESITDRRVGLVLSGHTHGGQIVLPGVGAPYVPSIYGQKYLHGLVRTDFTQVYVSRGLATIGPPLRIGARPEITLIRLTAAPLGDAFRA
jgi:predicted MPP superfamily phosphohydrolase